jgi:predicted membrane-bound spermidine synthase
MQVLLTAVFVLSGAAGLIYESIWSRYLGLFVGHSAYAQVIVLVIYLGGMSAGAAVASRYSERIRDPLIGYAIAEIAVGVIGLFFHDIFLGVSGFAYSSIFPALAGGGALLVAKWLIAGLLILPQSLLLGTTFPLMSAGVIRRVSRSTSDTGRTLSILYFANSIGAAVGVLIAGFYLIGVVGLPGTLLTAAVINLIVGFTVYGATRLVADTSPEMVLARTADEAAIAESLHRSREAAAQRDALPMLWRVLLVVSAGTALSSFIYEIAWVRMLSLVLGSATHSFELMLSAFILGLALGAFWVRTHADEFTWPIRALGVTQWLMGALAVLTLSLYAASFDWMALLLAALDDTKEGYQLFSVAKYVIALSVMLPATFCAGITLPLITRTLLHAGSGERAIGAVYSVNTLGSIVGAGLSSLVLMPWLGMKTLLVAGGVVDMALGVWLLAIVGRTQNDTRRFAIGVAGASVLVVLFATMNVNLDKGILSSGVYRYGKVPAAGTRTLAFYKDGRTATVSVRRDESGGYSLATNGKPDASLSPLWFAPDSDSPAIRRLDGDESTQVLLPLITLAYAGHPKQGAVIGNGSGMSSHFLLGSPSFEKLVTIDIEPEMIHGSHIFYPVNRRVFDDPRAQYVLDDAKSYFASNNRKFDLILSEPSNPWVSGVSGLFTDEFYRRVRTYLTPNGVLGQWLHLYEISDDLVLSVIAAVHKNFASYRIYLTADTDILIIASNQPELPEPDWSVFELPDIKQDLRHFSPLNGTAVEAGRLIDRATLAPLIGDGRGANSDFYPELDLNSEQTRYRREFAHGFYGLSDSRFDLGAALRDRRILPTPATDAVLNITRVKALAFGARLRRAEHFAPDDTLGNERDFRTSAAKLQLLRDIVAANRPPTDWPTFFKLATEVEADIQGGTMGWVDEPFHANVAKYLDAQQAPPDARAAWRFLHGISGYDWQEAATAAQIVYRARKQERSWLNADFFRDAAATAMLKTGKPDEARTIFNGMAEYATRKNEDLRVRLLEAYIAQAERAKAAGR